MKDIFIITTNKPIFGLSCVPISEYEPLFQCLLSHPDFDSGAFDLYKNASSKKCSEIYIKRGTNGQYTDIREYRTHLIELLNKFYKDRPLLKKAGLSEIMNKIGTGYSIWVYGTTTVEGKTLGLRHNIIISELLNSIIDTTDICSKENRYHIILHNTDMGLEKEDKIVDTSDVGLTNCNLVNDKHFFFYGFSHVNESYIYSQLKKLNDCNNYDSWCNDMINVLNELHITKDTKASNQKSTRNFYPQL